VATLAARPVDAKDKWTRVVSKNFTVVGNAGEADLVRLAAKLEEFRETLLLMFPKVNLTTTIPTTVVVFRSDDAFHPFKPRYRGKIRDNVGGYFLPGRRQNYIALALDKQALRPYEVIFHEYEHFLLRNNLLHIPLWLDEGLAEFYSTFQTVDSDQKVKVGVPLEQHVYYLRAHSILPLKTLLAVDHKSPHYNESSKAGVFYAESWALIHYLILGNQQKRQRQLVRFIDMLNSGAPAEDSFQKAFQTDFKTIEDDLRNYISRNTFPGVITQFDDPVSFSKETQVAELSEAEAQFYEGDLLLSLREATEAEAHLQKSLAQDPKLAASLVSLGVVRLAQRKPEEAAKLFQSAIDSDPKNYLAPYYYAQILGNENKFDEAIKFYRQSLALKADEAVVYSELGYTFLQAGREDEAIATFTEGLQANPREGYLYDALAYLYLQRGQGSAAANRAYSYIRYRGWREDHSTYMGIVWYFGLRQMKSEQYANKVLQETVDKADQTNWPYPVVRLLNKTMTLQEVLAQATDNDKLTEAHAYAGLLLSLEGDKAAAREHLQWVKENGNQKFVEYPLALAELARLERSATSQHE
jgi:tetratricopeptide (TPR) repeat protein